MPHRKRGSRRLRRPSRTRDRRRRHRAHSSRFWPGRPSPRRRNSSRRAHVSFRRRRFSRQRFSLRPRSRFPRPRSESREALFALAAARSPEARAACTASSSSPKSRSPSSCSSPPECSAARSSSLVARSRRQRPQRSHRALRAFSRNARKRRPDSPAWQDVLDHMRNLPGVQSATLSDIIPMREGENSLPYSTTPAPPIPPTLPLALASSVTPGYIDVMQLPLREGRFLTDHDRLGSEPVIVIDENFARHAFGTTHAVGKSPLDSRTGSTDRSKSSASSATSAIGDSQATINRASTIRCTTPSRKSPIAYHALFLYGDVGCRSNESRSRRDRLPASD